LIVLLDYFLNRTLQCYTDCCLTETKKGVAFDVIIKPASVENPPIPHGSPVKQRPISQVDIDRELKEAEDNRLAQLQAKQDRLKEHVSLGWMASYDL